MTYEYLLIKRNGNKDGLAYDRLFFNNSRDARKQFRRNDILFKCKPNSIYYDSVWKVNREDVVRTYEK